MSLPLNIDDLIHQRKVESARIEYKKDWNPEKVLHSVCAFANDIDNLGGGHIRSRFCRNRRIGEFLKELDLAEGRNTGIGKSVRAMRENGSPASEFYNPETRSFMTVILPIHEAFKANENEATVWLHIRFTCIGRRGHTRNNPRLDCVACQTWPYLPRRPRQGWPLGSGRASVERREEMSVRAKRFVR